MKYMYTILGACLLVIFSGCGSSFENPVERLKHQLKDVSTYSIILEDMKEDGNVFSHYFHKYKIIQLDNDWSTGWEEVSDSFYKQNENFLGMTLAVKKDGKLGNHVAPPGYAYVGDPNYGQWRTNNSGDSFWEFYGKYRMFADVLGMFMGGSIFQRDYDDYRHYRKRRQPFFGRNKQYGTRGSFTKRKNPSFFQRRMERERKKTSSFSDRVSKRLGSSNKSSKIGRTRSGFRSRSASYGK